MKKNKDGNGNHKGGTWIASDVYKEDRPLVCLFKKYVWLMEEVGMKGFH